MIEKFKAKPTQKYKVLSIMDFSYAMQVFQIRILFLFFTSRDARVAGHITITYIHNLKRIKLSPFTNPL